MAGCVHAFPIDYHGACASFRLRKRIYALHKLMALHLPRLNSHLHSIGMHAGYFATQWLATLFARILPLELFAHVWDRFLVDGMKMLFRVALVLLESMEPALLKASDMNEASILLSRNPTLPLAPSDATSTDWFVQAAMQFKVTRSILVDLEDQRHVELVHRWSHAADIAISSSAQKDDDLFYPEVDPNASNDVSNRKPLDMDQLCRDIQGLDIAIASDVAVFRHKIEQVHRAADAAVVAYMSAAAMFTEASYRLDELVEDRDGPFEDDDDGDDCDELVTQEPWYRRAFACFDVGGRMLSHVKLRGDDMDSVGRFHARSTRARRRWRQQRKDTAEVEYATRRQQLMNAQIEMDELHTFKTKVTEQFLAILTESERDKTAVLKRHFGDDTSLR
ncbi:hypothetical protein DYB32_000604 [Aphanomyces invadans]|uniref:Rab-GAP TBC domain-containing protein n=1 Tax=Aphanomyces invadans TaxID=157072 RepID=A0A418B9L8_9STRA|nr:hypothetical protein DYB32_000604 [Aphanomyces invadans]